MGTIIRTENLVKVFFDKKSHREIYAVNGLSIELKRGEIFGFLGPNGAGKTTTIRMMMGLLKPTAGYIEIFGTEIGKAGDRIRKHIGYLPENSGLYENLTVHENLAFFSEFYDISEYKDRIREVTEIMGVGDRLDMKVGKLSKGLKRRVDIARVLLHNPPLIFLDEPTSGLDPAAAYELRMLIKELGDSERTVIINSHNLDEIQKVCDRVAILNNGKIMRIGTPGELDKEVFGFSEYIIRTTVEIGDVSDILSGIDGIGKSIIDGKNIKIYLKNPENVIPNVIKKMVAADIPIVEVTRRSHSLEDIYLKLMGYGREN